MKLWSCAWGMLIFLAFLHSSDTKACDCDGPGATFLPSGGVLPANAKGLAWFTPCVWCLKVDKKPALPKKSRFRVESVDKKGSRHLKFEISFVGEQLLLVRPVSKMKPGQSYIFSFNKCYLFDRMPKDFFKKQGVKHDETRCERSWVSVEVTVGDQSVKPMKSRPTLRIGPLERGDVTLSSSLSCSADVEAGKRSVELLLPPTAAKYKQALLYETIVDGEPWRPSLHVCENRPIGRSWTDLGKDLLYSNCNESSWLSGLKKGSYKVRMTATLPGVGVIADSGEVEVEIGCE